jgi:hypothetical protein
MKLAFQEIEAPRAAAAYRDARADGGQRDVTLTNRQVTIGRQVHGVRMKVHVPVASYLGVALGLESTLGGRLCYKVGLRHHDSDLEVLLIETFDEDEAMSMWRGWAEHLSLALIVQRVDGVLERFADAPLKAQSFARRRGTPQTVRSRGRFARRRRTGVTRDEDLVHRGEREIVCYE